MSCPRGGYGPRSENRSRILDPVGAAQQDQSGLPAEPRDDRRNPPVNPWITWRMNGARPLECEHLRAPCGRCSIDSARPSARLRYVRHQDGAFRLRFIRSIDRPRANGAPCFPKNFLISATRGGFKGLARARGPSAPPRGGASRCSASNRGVCFARKAQARRDDRCEPSSRSPSSRGRRRDLPIPMARVLLPSWMQREKYTSSAAN